MQKPLPSICMNQDLSFFVVDYALASNTASIGSHFFSCPHTAIVSFVEEQLGDDVAESSSITDCKEGKGPLKVYDDSDSFPIYLYAAKANSGAFFVTDKELPVKRMVVVADWKEYVDHLLIPRPEEG